MVYVPVAALVGATTLALNDHVSGVDTELVLGSKWEAHQLARRVLHLPMATSSGSENFRTVGNQLFLGGLIGIDVVSGFTTWKREQDRRGLAG